MKIGICSALACKLDDSLKYIGVDHGVEILLKQGIKPVFAIGDFDSIENENVLSELDIERLPTRKDVASFSNKYFIDINIYIIDSNYFKNLPTTSYISQATYNRFLIPLLLKGITSKVLYLDADIICLGNIKQIFNIKLDNITAGVIEESNN